MGIDDLESEIKKIVEISEGLPERYRDRCFEMLLANLTENKSIAQEIPETLNSVEVAPQTFIIPIEVRALLRQFGVDEAKIFELFLITGADEVVPIYKINTTVTAKGQIQISLLTALENTLKGNGQFSIGIEDIRQRCKDNKCYNHKNFTNNFSNNIKYFKESEVNETLTLSPYGKEKLIETINAF